MNCREFLEKLDDFFDERLSSGDSEKMELHARRCSDCGGRLAGVRELSRILGRRSSMPEVAAQQMLREIQRPRFSLRSLFEKSDVWMRRWLDQFESRYLWSKLSAVPFTLIFFALILNHFSPERMENLAYLVVSEGNYASEGGASRHQMLNIKVRPNRRDMEALVTAAWKLPYEDSLFLVAGISSEGRAEIDSVLQRPRSEALLRAVHLNLEGTKFDGVEVAGNSLLLYSFQKIDVYEDQLGL